MIDKQLLEFSILNIDKPSGPTSFDISDLVRKKLGVRKTSHFGTLDPKVTGVLPIALNRACKLTGFFLGEDKEYVGVMRIHKDISLEKIKKIIKEKFVGKIKQTPPVKSRVKRQEREREIKKFEILERQEAEPLASSSKNRTKDGQNILFRVECEGGTYIRKLIDDLGKELGVGAHMLELRRIRAGPFTESGIFFGNEKHRAGIFREEDSINLYDLEKAVTDEKLLKKILIPADEALKKIFPVVKIKEKSVKKLLTGKPIFKEDILDKIPGEKFVAFSESKFIGVYKKTNDGKIVAKPEFVLQDVK